MNILRQIVILAIIAICLIGCGIKEKESNTSTPSTPSIATDTIVVLM